MHMSPGAQGGKKGSLDALGLQIVVSLLTWALGTKLRSSEAQYTSLTSKPFLQPQHNTSKNVYGFI